MTMTPESDSPSNLKRQRLRVAVNLMLAVAFLVMVYVSVSSFQSNTVDRPSLPSLSVDLSEVSSSEAITVNWNDRPVIVVRRTPAEIAALAQENPALTDASSSSSEQPDFARVSHRSRDPQWFVAIALGTDFSCPVDRVPAVPAAIMGSEGQAGLKDSCRGSYYDLAGRVLRGQYADRNLAIPPYQLSGLSLTLGVR